jgi:hypothetical protein
MSGLTLIYSGITVNLTVFTANTWPRKRLNPPEVSRTANNTPIVRGFSFEAPHIWQVEAILNDSGTRPSDADRMDALYDLWQQNGGNITLYDETRDFVEESPRTRAIVSGGTTTTVATGVIAYPAQFNVQFSGDMNRTGQGVTVVYSFQLVEMEATTAA